jgi:5-methylcytosine-specific restriction endonuclease McrA
MPDLRKYADRAVYLRQAVSKRRKKLRELARQYKGGECIICGYKQCQDALEFHHLNPKGKDFGLSSRGLTRSWEKIKKEIDKCILICSNCHREVHAGVTQLPKETSG